MYIILPELIEFTQNCRFYFNLVPQGAIIGTKISIYCEFGINKVNAFSSMKTEEFMEFELFRIFRVKNF